MAVYANLFMDQGTDFRTTINLEGGTGAAFDITDYDILAQMRKSYSSNKSYDFDANVNDGENGVAILEMTAATTNAIKPGRYVYDVQVKSPQGVYYRVVEGQIEVSPAVSRPNVSVSGTVIIDGGAADTDYSAASGVFDGGGS
jgi:hypothetical protein